MTNVDIETGSLFSVENKRILVTGGSRGIGAMIAEAFVRNGARVYISSRKFEDCAATANRLSEVGHCVAIPTDLSHLEGVEGLVSAYSAHETRLDVLVNNAGAIWGAPLEAYPETGWDKTVDLNLKSVFFLTQKCLPLMRNTENDQARSHVVNVASIHGMINPKEETYAYSASKAGLIHLTKHLASDLAADGICVNAIAPGLFPSNMTKDFDQQAVIDKIPFRRAGMISDIAGAAIFLSSPASSWVTGVCVPVDGGLVASV